MDSVTPELATAPVALTSTSHEGEERVVVFTMERFEKNPEAPDGDLIRVVEEYTIPKRHRPNIGLRFLWEMKTLGDGVATANLLEAALGTEGFLALVGHDDLTVEQNERIQRMILSYTMGDVEKGKAR
jgi:hypothetical protein